MTNRSFGKRNSVKKPSTDRKVAIIGSGPAGLTAAYYLANQGHSVKIFESLPLAGGMLRYGIPEYRLPRDVIDEEIGDIEKLGVEIQTNARVESVDTLLNDGYDAILIAVGANKGVEAQYPGSKWRGCSDRH